MYSARPQGDREYFVSEDGERLSDQSWTANVGALNYERIFTDSRISSDFLRIFVWTFILQRERRHRLYRRSQGRREKAEMNRWDCCKHARRNTSP